MPEETTYNKQTYTDRELLKLFPEAKDIIPLKIKELQKITRGKERVIEQLLCNIYSLGADNFSIWFAEKLIEIFFMPEIQKYNRKIMQLRRFQALLNPVKKDTVSLQENIEQARNFPIFEVASRYLELRQVGNKYLGLCPFHSEHSPSFYIYSQTNSFHCFGCQENGDSIKLQMALGGLDFKQAVEMLSN
jgi:hypothetical protein